MKCILPFFLVFICSVGLADQVQLAKKAYADARTFSGKNLIDINCTVFAMQKYNGKCVLSFGQLGPNRLVDMEYLASPEVAIPFNSDYIKKLGLSWDKLTIVVSVDGEIVQILDKDGQKISQKMDFSR